MWKWWRWTIRCEIKPPTNTSRSRRILSPIKLYLHSTRFHDGAHKSMNLHKNPQSKHRSPKTKLVLGEEREWSRAENVLIMHAVGAARIRRDNDAHVCNEQAQPVCSTTKRSGDFDTYRFIHDQRTLVGWLVGRFSFEKNDMSRVCRTVKVHSSVRRQDLRINKWTGACTMRSFFSFFLFLFSSFLGPGPVFSTARLTFRCRAISLSTKARINYFVSRRLVSYVRWMIFEFLREMMIDSRNSFFIYEFIAVLVSLLPCKGAGISYWSSVE